MFASIYCVIMRSMDILNALLGNRILMTSVLGWLIAQVLKTIIHYIVSGEMVAERLTGSGGMPSSHSATVCALALSVAFNCGVDSPEFAIALIVAIIVMYDARGVRRETGIQAELLNDMLKVFEDMGRDDISSHDKMKEFVGHTPLQVMVGAVLGILVAIAMQFVYGF